MLEIFEIILTEKKWASLNILLKKSYVFTL